MATHLQQLLRSLCLNTEWNYAVLWKLEHRARMVLTLDDAYYQSHPKHGLCESTCTEALGSLRDGHFSHDALGLAVAKMSYHVYSLGEGIIGQVAVTGKHQWIFSDEHQHVVNSLSSSEHYDGWQAQFLAGVQTIVIAAVVPHGVVQLGSLSKVNEDLKLVARLRDLFSMIQDFSANHVSNPMQKSLQTMPHMPDILHGCLLDPAKAPTVENACVPLQKLGDFCRSFTFPPRICEAVKLARSSGLDSSILEDVENDKMVDSAYKKQEPKAVTDDNVQKVPSISQCNIAESQSLCDAILSTNKYGVTCNYSSSSSLGKKLQRNVGNNLEFPADDNYLDALTSSCKPSAGYELHEVLGPAFLKQNYPSWWETEKSEPASVSEIADGMEHSMLTSDTGTDHLLDAVVANFCSKDGTFKRVKSFATSADSLLTTEKTPEPSSNTSHTVGSASYSMDCSSILEKSIQHCLTSSDSYGMRTSNGLSSSGPSLRKGQSLGPPEPVKGNKKRARPGESCRPRPRDRQLIQDRIKELRELVPSGSKCSIDSLLERTIKHMLFLQSISKHADKLNSCARSKVNKEGCSSHEQGASWAVEVGGHMKICPIVVENLNMNGQLMIEMLCEDCDHFLQIAEAIRGLGLTILKGITEGHGDKTWMRFVVEGQNNRKMHRMDVLWSLVQILQTETAI